MKFPDLSIVKFIPFCCERKTEVFSLNSSRIQFDFVI